MSTESWIAANASSEPGPTTTAPDPGASAYEAKESSLSLPDGRTLAYSHSGPCDSDIFFIWFPGLFSVGDTSNPAPPIQQRHAQNLSPTLPGWGNTSPPLPGKTFAETVVSDTHALLRHLRPRYNPATLRIYVAGGSFGTVPTQMVFGAPYDAFPYGRQIAGMMLMAPFSPFREQAEYREGLSWRDWVSVGPLTQVVPGRGVQRLVKVLLQGKTRDVPSAEAFLRKEFFGPMNEKERERYAVWRARRGVEEGYFERWMAAGMVKSVSKTWEGFLATADAMHSEWGFRIRELDEEHASKPVVLALGKEDRSLLGMGRWLSESYRNVTVRELEGGHLAGAWSVDDVLEDLFVAGGDASGSVREGRQGPSGSGRVCCCRITSLLCLRLCRVRGNAKPMALFSASESVYLSSFLSSVDLDSSINNDGSVDPGLADQIPHLQGSEALAKATKDLMSLDVPVTSARPQSAGQPTHTHLHPSASSQPSYWPSFPSSEQAGSSSSSGTAAQQHKLAQIARSSSPAQYLSRGLSGTIAPADSLRSTSQSDRANPSIFGQQQQPQHVQIAPLRGYDAQTSSPGFNLPPISTAGYPNGVSTRESSRPPVAPSASAPSVLTSSSTTTTSNKRPLHPSSEPATDPSSSKRARPSPSSASFSSVPEADSALASGSSSASTRPRADSPAAARKGTPSASPSAAARRHQSPAPDNEADKKDKGKEKIKSSGAGGGGGSANKGALLSPSQKRANHIQSEQKRRANIRRGYEALCEVVPALREAIRAEEERERAGEDADAKGKDRAAPGGAGAGEKGKKKRKSESERQDGRAGPRSENVVLQKTIDYITALLADRAALTQRLEIARGILPLGHPAAQIDARHLDAQGVPLWEREWNGGMDLDAGAGEDGSEDEG
ncbi:hypothetical protein BV20DRAFT_1002877 [Pilatotrama ljubarskyi]|nr:hypothetical protein BV20DRAFT_1002877 [Pilatotrama ljubarskyi]